MNWQGVITHNLIALAALGLGFALVDDLPPFFYILAGIIPTFYAYREALQRTQDFEGISLARGFLMNLTGPGELARPEDAERSLWDWRLQGYGPAAIALVLVLLSFLL